MKTPHRQCVDCGYPLTGLREHRCPECGLPFDPDREPELPSTLFMPGVWQVVAIGLISVFLVLYLPLMVRSGPARHRASLLSEVAPMLPIVLGMALGFGVSMSGIRRGARVGRFICFVGLLLFGSMIGIAMYTLAVDLMG